MQKRQSTAAENLVGLDLPGGWHVDERTTKLPNQTGGNFSVGYLVRRDRDTRGYLKALDFAPAFESADIVGELKFLTTAYDFERDILQLCHRNRLDRVVTAVADGTVSVEGPYAIKKVPYLIFELADGDIRARFDIDRVIDVPWRLRSLHHTATGLNQLHGQGIAHQDLKPSNVLVFHKKESKVADLGRAVTSSGSGPFDQFIFSGDLTYAPPEVLYGHFDPEWRFRCLGCDAYHLGSLLLFFFGQVSTTPALMSKLALAHRPKSWAGTFQEVLPYLTSAFDLVLEDFKAEIKRIEPKLESELTQMLVELCEPNPDKRGDAVLRRQNLSNPFSLERYISRLDRLAYRAATGIL